mmetsp:Transcript_3773/g.8043  ORF Transcript_3773/g.8043 Transcript_3773/m.8043 type:complete len:214 (-) Transcript_3773:21-662(-)
MEDVHIGTQCCIPSCRQKTYLPINCSSCNQLYCSEHAIHDCITQQLIDKAVKVLLCSMCTQARIASCEVCARDVCASHRFHECQEEKPALSEHKAPPPKKVFRAPDTKPTNPTAAKLLKMRVRARATGDPSIPSESRFALRFECEEGNFPQELYIGDYQQLGIAIDRMTTQGRITRGEFTAVDPSTSTELSASKTPLQLGLENGQTIVLSRLS